jgi:hypothetical protein
MERGSTVSAEGNSLKYPVAAGGLQVSSRTTAGNKAQSDKVHLMKRHEAHRGPQDAPTTAVKRIAAKLQIRGESIDEMCYSPLISLALMKREESHRSHLRSRRTWRFSFGKWRNDISLQ